VDDIDGDLAPRRTRADAQPTAPALVDRPGPDVQQPHVCQRVYRPETDAAFDCVVGVGGCQGPLVERQRGGRQLFQGDELRPGVDQSLRGTGGSGVLVTDVVLDRRDVMRAAIPGKQRPAEEVSPDSHGEQQGHQRGGRAAQQGQNEQHHDGEAEPGQECLQQTAQVTEGDGHGGVEDHQARSQHGKRCKNTSTRPARPDAGIPTPTPTPALALAATGLRDAATTGVPRSWTPAPRCCPRAPPDPPTCHPSPA
jgi:hypothetical protein